MPVAGFAEDSAGLCTKSGHSPVDELHSIENKRDKLARILLTLKTKRVELNPAIQCISLQPDSPFHGIEGTKHMASAIIPKIYDSHLADQDMSILTEEAYGMAKRLAREAGVLVGISAAAAVVGCLKIAEELRLKEAEQAVIVTILCDSGDKYLSERFWTEE